MKTSILCSNPSVILHPLAGEFISRYGAYFMFGKLHKVNKRSLYFSKFVSFLSPKRNCINVSNYEDCFFIDLASGETFPMYILVKCGKCDNCKCSKVNSFVHRCKLESMNYNSQPIFLTLTYNNETLPKKGLCIRDVQLFFKRLRINLYRRGYCEKLRYVCVGEYGKNTHRAHYHAILWNLHQSDILSYQSIGKIIEKSWNLGFEMHRLIDLRDDKAFYYTAKYLRKDCFCPSGCNKTFMVSSNRGGGIGAPFIDSLNSSIRKTFDIKPTFLNKFNGKVEPLNLNSYVINRLFPSLSRVIGSNVRSALKRFVYNYSLLRDFESESVSLFNINLNTYTPLYDFAVSFFSKFLYVYTPSHVANTNHKTIPQVVSEMSSDEIILRRFFFSTDSFDKVYPISLKRQFYIDKLFRYNSHPVILDSRGKDFKRKSDYLTQFEIL